MSFGAAGKLSNITTRAKSFGQSVSGAAAFRLVADHKLHIGRPAGLYRSIELPKRAGITAGKGCNDIQAKPATEALLVSAGQNGQAVQPGTSHTLAAFLGHDIDTSLDFPNVPNS